jgi:hypothetical protein
LTTSECNFSIRQLFYYILLPLILPAPEFKGLAVTANEAKKNVSTAFSHKMQSLILAQLKNLHKGLHILSN